MTRAAAIFALVMILLSAFVTAGTLYGRFSQTSKIRQSNVRVWHAVVCSIEHAAIKQKNHTVQEKRLIIRFYDNLLVNDVHAAPCGITVTGR